MNSVQLIGNLATEVEVREVGDDKKLATFVLAVDRPGQDRGADFVRIATWERQAEACGRYLTKGKRISVEGRLRSRSWEDPDGKRRSSLEVVASRVEFLSPREGASSEVMPFEPAAAT